MFRLQFLIIVAITMISAYSCQYENAEELYYSTPNNQPVDTTHNDNDTITVEPALLLDIPFNESIEDISENDFTIITHGDLSLTADRYWDDNQALYLNGEDQYIEIDINNQDSISVSFWFNCSSGRSSLSSLFDYGKNAIKTNIDGYSGPTTFYVTTFYNNLDELNADYYFQYFTWYHIYVTSCGRPAIYVNGEKAGDIQKNIKLNIANSNLVFGKSVQENANDEKYFHGVIDDIKIFNYALTNQEIGELFNAAKRVKK